MGRTLDMKTSKDFEVIITGCELEGGERNLFRNGQVGLAASITATSLLMQSVVVRVT